MPKEVYQASLRHAGCWGCRLTDEMLMEQTNDWDFFNRFYCISLEERTDRRAAAAAQFARVGLAGKVEFVIVKRHPSDIEQGMYESHMSCLCKGLEAGAKRIVVFEDDILFDRFDAGRLNQCTRFLSAHPDWKVMLFGALISRSWKISAPCVQKVGYQSLAHAYALNRPYAETLAYKPWCGIVIDTLFRPLADHIYAVYPMFAFQSDLPSDNDKYLYLDRLRRRCGGLQRIQKMNELYHRHKLWIIGVHSLILASLSVLALHLFFR
jgi:hypothetical protein